MGKLNRVVNILVLILAIVSVYFAVQLFNKREQLVDGWKKMSNSVKATADALDQGSGTTSAAEVDGLDHHNYAKLDTALPKLKEQAEAVIKQRDALAGGISKAVEAAGSVVKLDDAKLKSLKDSATEQDAAISALNDIKSRDNGLIDGIAALGSKVDVNVDKEALKDVKGYTAPMSTVTAKVENVKKRMTDFGDKIAQIASTLSIPAPSLQGDEYATALGDTVKAVEGYRDAYNKTKQELANEQIKVKEREATIAEKVAKIGELEKTISTKDSKIKELAEIIYGPDGEPADKPNILKPYDPELLKALKGQIVDVNTKWDFVVIDLGSKSIVKQQVGRIISDVASPLPNNTELLVSRDDKEFVGKIKVVKVYDNCAIANVVNDTKKTIVKPGDTVSFSDEVVQKLKDEANKKAAAAAQAPAADAAAAPAAPAPAEK